jgi:hypothetical protein
VTAVVPELVAELVAGPVGMHLGALHPYEKVLTVVLAFGPFIVLGAVIAVRRRHDEDEDDTATRPGPDHPTAR